jgi:hypothetical protein
MEEDKKTELDLEIWKMHQEKEAKSLKKIFIFIFLSSCIGLHSKSGLVAIYDSIPKYESVKGRSVAQCPRTGF